MKSEKYPKYADHPLVKCKYKKYADRPLGIYKKYADNENFCTLCKLFSPSWQHLLDCQVGQGLNFSHQYFVFFFSLSLSLSWTSPQCLEINSTLLCVLFVGGTRCLQIFLYSSNFSVIQCFFCLVWCPYICNIAKYAIYTNLLKGGRLTGRKTLRRTWHGWFRLIFVIFGIFSRFWSCLSLGGHQ